MFSNKNPYTSFYFYQMKTYRRFPLDYSPLFYNIFKTSYFPEYDNIKLKLNIILNSH